MSREKMKSGKQLQKKSKMGYHPKKARPEDDISKSKKLVTKLQTSRRNKPHSSSQSNNNSGRLSGNGRPMPPLSDLEKMFEDSDDEDQPKIVTPQKSQSPVSSSIITTKKLTSPKTIKKIADKMMVMISNLPHSTFNIENGLTPNEPGKKLKSSQISSIIDCEEPTQKSSKKPRKKADPQIWEKDNERSDFSDGSLDSNKTIEYDFNKTYDRPQLFSPLPSTSRDSDTININDQLFNDSLFSDTSTNRNQSNINKKNTILNQTNDDVKIIENPCEVIVIGDDIETSRPVQKRKRNEESEIIECIEIVDSGVNRESIKIRNGEKIIIGDSSKINYNPVQSEQITEVIDVEDLIAQNKAIIEKFSKEPDNYINTVTCVDSSNISLLNNDPTCTEPAHESSVPRITEKFKTTNEQNGSSFKIGDIVADFFKRRPNLESFEVTNPECSEQLRWKESIDVLKSLSYSHLSSSPGENFILIDDLPLSTTNICSRPAVTRTSHPFFSNLKTHSTSCKNDKSKHNRDMCDKNHHHHTTSEHHNLFPNENLQHPNSKDYDCPRCMHGISAHHSTSEHHFYFPTNSRSNSTNHKSIQQSNYSRNEERKSPASKRLKTRTAAAASPNRTPVKNYGDCPICMDSLANKTMASTICGHVFCLKCIESALKTGGRKCPTCRKVLKKGGYHQLFL
ncbi:uncharacterized protein LOC106129338 [Amyelois transitella]|uniref:uncharacterized protein LOC106129338 n=1 Tax=Amyelois transitella TaxID=680683 RepID=UPI00067AFD69|nr:uncharacterized protein LOC106129338 [Amyelois transitella]XP_013183323.1 uncharacterized protein LOC106129338 [Amyelois transitella]XP_060810512.1 uncharacterized protein LOC106129338 [Amyelois transitella]